MGGEEIIIDNLRFKMTCIACPEQYDVFDPSENQVAYVRLRHGELRCDYPKCGGETIYEAEPEGDGCFDSDEERDYHLEKIAIRVKKRLLNDSLMQRKI